MNVPRNGFDPNQQNSNLYFAFQVQSEPKAPLVGIGEPRLTKAEDEHGQSLLMPANANEYGARYYENGGYRNFQYQTQVQLNRPGRDSTKAKIIQGRVPVALLAATRPEVTLTKVAKGQKAQGPGAELDVDDLQEQNKTYFLTLTVKRFDRNPEQDPNWANFVWQRLELIDAQGRKYQSQGTNNFLSAGPSAVQASFQFA